MAAELNNLNAVLSVTFPLKIGDSFLLTALVHGIVNPEPDAQNNDADVINDIAMLSSAGAVNFANTANLRILLPEGYSLGGDAPLLTNIVLTTPVPLPSAFWLMAGGIGMFFRICHKVNFNGARFH